MQKVTKALLVFLSGLVCLVAQTDVKVLPATLNLAEPVSGKLALMSASLLFVDDAQPENSFLLTKDNVQSIRAEAEIATIQLAKPVKDRSGATTRVIFRLSTPAEAAELAKWTSGAATAATPGANDLVFNAQRKKRLRSNTDGKLIVDNERMIFESTENASESRRWELKEIREFKLKNPYEVIITASTDEKYTLSLSGRGMDNAQYREIVDRITKARTSR
jgi:hypothetical protein